MQLDSLTANRRIIIQTGLLPKDYIYILVIGTTNMFQKHKITISINNSEGNII